MKIKEHYKLHNVSEDEYILMLQGEGQVDLTNMIMFNASSAYLWNCIVGKEFTVQDVTNLLLEEYEVEEQVAADDAAVFVDNLIKAGVLV